MKKKIACILALWAAYTAGHWVGWSKSATEVQHGWNKIDNKENA